MNDQLRSDLQSPDLDRRIAAAERLASLGAEAAIAAVELVRACADEETVQEWAVAALESMGPPPVDSLPQLCECSSASNALVAYWAVTLLGRLGASASSSQQQLAAILTHSTVTATRERAAWALGQIGASSNVSITALRQAAEASEPRLSRLAKEALMHLVE